MGFEITQGAVFYIVVMIIVIFVGIALVTGLKPWELVNKFSNTFESGKLYLTDTTADLQAKTVLDCREAAYRLRLEKPKLAYKLKPGERSADFIIVLDHYNILFPGKYTNKDGSEKYVITCSSPRDEQDAQCPQELELEFLLQGIGRMQGKQNFHFTAWYAKPAVVDAVTQQRTTLNYMLETYSDSYISSFDTVVSDVEEKCVQFDCENAGENECRNMPLCYWNAPLSWFNSCEACPTSTTCADYSPDACEKCAIAVENCHVGGGLLGIGDSCVPN